MGSDNKKSRLTFKLKKRSFQFDRPTVVINRDGQRIGAIMRLSHSGAEWFWYAYNDDGKAVNTSSMKGTARSLEGCKAEVKRFINEGVLPGEKPKAKKERKSKGGIVLPDPVEPEEPTSEAITAKPWSFTVGFNPIEDNKKNAKEAIEVLYRIALGRCGVSRELWEKRERIQKLLNQVAEEMVGEVPSIEELC